MIEGTSICACWPLLSRIGWFLRHNCNKQHIFWHDYMTQKGGIDFGWGRSINSTNTTTSTTIPSQNNYLLGCSVGFNAYFPLSKDYGNTDAAMEYGIICCNNINMLKHRTWQFNILWGILVTCSIGSQRDNADNQYIHYKMTNQWMKS